MFCLTQADDLVIICSIILGRENFAPYTSSFFASEELNEHEGYIQGH